MTAPARRPRTVEDLLLVSLERLAATGEVEAACRLAGAACAQLRTDDPRTAQRFNALLHRLTRALPALPAGASIHPREETLP